MQNFSTIRFIVRGASQKNLRGASPPLPGRGLSPWTFGGVGYDPLQTFQFSLLWDLGSQKLVGINGSPRLLVPTRYVCMYVCIYVCMYILTAKAFHISRGDYGLDPSIMGNKHAGRRKNTHH